ncbi:sodium channel protein Nach [Calliphora vicina]|uniref:sodium channel protein Nach n=1 Tax=Calliphora vicina TaxID=7373 RepID=UPI00325A7290
MKTYPLAYQNQQHQLKQQPQLKQQRKKRLLQRKQQQQQQQEKQQPKHKVGKEETDVALVVGRAAWWIPVLATNNNMRNLTFAQALRDFLQNVSFHCYGKLVETGRRYQERLFWLVFHIAALSTLIIFLLNNRNTGGQLLATTIYDPLYPIRKVPFPTVSICSINRISNASATRYAEELNRKDPRKRGVNFFYEQIKMLQYNYYVQDDIRDYYKALTFQRFLDIYDREDTELFYNTRRRMAKLTPNCSDILVQCRLGGKYINCAEEFQETFTSRGLCCTFNNNKKYSKERSFRKRYFGENLGLILLLSSPQKDSFYKMFTLDGFIVDIHSPTLYPDHSSGGVEERFVQTGIDTYLAVTPRIFQTVSEARFLRPKARNCLFNDELPASYGNDYTFNNCVTLCRIRSIFILCGCMLFPTPYENLTNPIDTVFCSLQHKECLMRYDFKWYNVITQRQNIRGLEREMEDALYCPDCLPSCSETKYSVQVMGLPLNEYNMKSFPEYKKNYTDLALVRIFFGETSAVFFKRVLVDSWFEIFSHVGNICGIIAGFSLIGICEVVFFCIQQLFRAYKNEVQWDGNRRVNADQPLMILP